MKALDFFCGAGGMTRGFLNAGIEVLGGVDLDSSLKRSYEENNLPSRFISRDISKLNINALRRLCRISPEDVVVYIACCPCQPFSTLNHSKAGDDRKNLLMEFMELVRIAPPDYIVIENVPGLNNSYGRDVYDKCAKCLVEEGFIFRYEQCLDAQYYGVPQVRKRFILIASRLGPIAAPIRAPQRITVREAIGHFPDISHGTSHPDYTDHTARKLMDHHMALIQAVPMDGGSRADVADLNLLLKCHRRNPDAHKDVFGRMSWDGVAPTLTARCTDIYCGRFAHPQQHRGISIREAAALQTFPPEYIFHGLFHQKGRQIGNAVPVELARRVGEALLTSHRILMNV